MSVLDRSVLARPQRLAAVERARRVLPLLVLRPDAVARLAAKLVGAPIAMVCLAGRDAEILLGGHGIAGAIDNAPGAEGPLSVGAYIVSAGRPTAVPDVTAEPDLRADPLTIQPGFRAFAGVPLRDADGEPVGSLAVVDTAARPWSDRDLANLTSVADLIGALPGGRARSTVAKLPSVDNSILLDMVRESFVAIDAEGRIVGWNRAAEETFGWPAPQALGHRMDQLIMVDPTGEDFDRGLEARLATPAERSTAQHAVCRHRDGHEFPVETITHTLPSTAGPIVAGFLLDISGRVAAERVADEHRVFLSTLLDSLLTGVVGIDAEGNVVVINRALRDVYGLPETWTEADLAPLSHRTQHGDGSPMPPEETPLLRAFNGEVVRGVDIVLRPHQRPERTFVTNAQPMFSSDGRRLGAVVALHDVTDTRRAEKFQACELEVVKALAYAEDVGTAGRAVLKAVGSTLGWPYGQMWLVDDLAGLLRAAATWSREDMRFELHRGPLAPGQGLAGQVWSRNEIRWAPDLEQVGDPELAVAATRAGLRAALALPIRGDDAVQGVLVLFAEAAEELPEQITTLLSAMAAHVGAFLARQYARGLAVELGRSRDDFLSLVGHAMRTPLTSIAAYTDLLLSQAQEQDRQLLAVVAKHTDSLRRIIDDLLELAGLQSGHIAIEPRAMDLVSLARTAVAEAGQLAQENRVEFITDLPPTLRIRGDPKRLARVLDNLLSNAVKYSPDGGTVRVCLRTVGKVVDLVVTDSGVGVPADERERLFQRFFRASNVLERGIAGTGLGLTTARAIVEAHGGQISVADRPGDEPGTIVTVRLPQSNSGE